MIRKLRLWWIGYRIKHIERMLSEAIDAQHHAFVTASECREQIDSYRVRAMLIVNGK